MQTHINTIGYSLASFDAPGILYKKHFILWVLFTLSAFSFLTTLGLPYQGEEAVYTLTSFEMWYQKEWFVPTLYGNEYGRPPLYNWCIICLANWIGWQHMLVAARLVTLIATLGSTLILFFFAEQLFRNRTFTLLTTCIYLSGDLLLRRGWLAYADPIFSFFVFLAIASLWFSLQNRQKYWLMLAALALFASYLTKAFTGYIFYAGTVLVFLFRHPNRNILWSLFSLIMHCLSVLLLVAWDNFSSGGSHNEGMVGDILTKFTWNDILSYGLKLTTFPLEILYRWLPCTGLLLYFACKDFLAKKRKINEIFSLGNSVVLPPNSSAHLNFKLVFWVFFINYLPYWIAPFARVRYLLPLYPFIAILLAQAIYCLPATRTKVVLYGLYGCLIVKYIVGCWGYAYYEENHRGSYAMAAIDIFDRVGEYPLYTNNVAATGLSVTAHLDLLRFPKRPLQWPPEHTEWTDGFILNYSPTLPNAPNVIIAKIYSFGGSKLYLLFRTGSEMLPNDTVTDSGAVRDLNTLH